MCELLFYAVMRHHDQGNLHKFYLKLTGSTVLEKYPRAHGLRYIVNLMVDDVTAVAVCVWGGWKDHTVGQGSRGAGTLLELK